jgi:RNA polymerase primary sigma factor
MSDLEWYMETTRKYRILDREEQDNLCKIIYERKDEKSYKQAKDKLILHNIPLVVNIVQKYSRNGEIKTDYIQEGCIGLSIAVDKFNPNIGVKFTTYAYWCVMRMILMASIKDRTIRIPAHVEYKLKRVNKLTENKDLEDALMDVRMSKALWEELHEKAFSFKTPQSLDLIKETAEASLSPHDIVPDTQGTSPEQHTFINEHKEDVTIIIAMLTPRQQKVIKLYYGIDCEPHSKAKISKLLGYSPEVVRNLIISSHDKIQRIIVRNRMLHLIPNFVID